MYQHPEAGWWFGTWMDYDFPFSWECHHPNWLSLHHFAEGYRYTTNQINIFYGFLWLENGNRWIYQHLPAFTLKITQFCRFLSTTIFQSVLVARFSASRWPSETTPGTAAAFCSRWGHRGHSRSGCGVDGIAISWRKPCRSRKTERKNCLVVLWNHGIWIDFPFSWE